MPYTVQVSFDTFHDNINLGGDHRATANSRRDNVVAKLSKDFAIVDSFSTGSIPKMTALHGHADLDVMVGIGCADTRSETRRSPLPRIAQVARRHHALAMTVAAQVGRGEAQ